jgi:cation-transporting ATPase 13A3/4/5
VFRNGVWKDVCSEDIVPGDLYEISENVHILPCDSVLISGDCIVNESMLTGEAVPVFKTPASDLDLSTMNTSTDINSKYYLFGGTKIVRVRGSNLEGLPSMQALAMAVRTGFNTTKGSLVRSMMFPKPNKFQFYEDSFKFLGVLGLIATCGFLLTLIWFIKIKVPWDLIVIRALDLITIVIPPALPAAMSIGTSFAIGRLKKENIYCISPPRVNVCGKLDMLVFDKTGTLTEEGLDVLGVSASTYDGPSKPPFFTDLISNGSQLSQVSQSASDQESVQLIKTSDQFTESNRIPLYFMHLQHVIRLKEFMEN